MPIRIAFVGAGSVEFTRDLLVDLIAFDDLPALTVALHDIDPERLETGEGVARQVIERSGAQARVSGRVAPRAPAPRWTAPPT